MQISHTIGQSLFQSGIIYFLQEWYQVFLGAMQEPSKKQVSPLCKDLIPNPESGVTSGDQPLRNHVGGAESEDVNGSEAGLSA